VSLGLLFNRKIKGLSKLNTTVSDSNGNNLDFETQAIDKLEFSIAYRLDIKTSGTDKLTLKLKNFDFLLEENKQKTLEELLEIGITDVDRKRLVSDDALIIEIKENSCNYYPQASTNSRTEQYNTIIQDQRKTIEELIELEPDNRFAHSQLIFLVETALETYSNAPENLKKRIELNKIVVASSENLLSKNPKYFHKFSYFLKLYKFK
jgi:hypothetical protein